MPSVNQQLGLEPTNAGHSVECGLRNACDNHPLLLEKSRRVKQSTPVRLAALLLALIPVAFSQAHPTQRPPDGGTREVLVSILLPSLPNAPFSAIVSTESIRQLADGTTITLKNRRAIARDSAGRILAERSALSSLCACIRWHGPQVPAIEINDPELTTWFFADVPGKTYASGNFFQPAFCRPELLTKANRAQAPSTECRPKQSINGLDPVGTRETSGLGGRIGLQ